MLATLTEYLKAVDEWEAEHGLTIKPENALALAMLPNLPKLNHLKVILEMATIIESQQKRIDDLEAKVNEITEPTAPEFEYR